ncbi:MAG: cation:proton antiporter [Acidimicrobiia bacterium]|nr:cation:proton antiporter [Acidimicrobiia bacterium]
MDGWLVLAAFAFGFIARTVGLPPLVGYLLAGFVAGELGFDTTPTIEALGDAGILLLLFGIGLKLDINSLRQPRVWGTTMAVSVGWTGALALLLLGLGRWGWPLADELDVGAALVIAFALSFSSTVYAVKSLEQTNEASSLNGRIAIGVLIIQDLIAVAFLVGSSGSWPSIWAVAVVLGLVVARPLLEWILTKSGHGEILLLFGFALAVVVGAESFNLVGLKADLGALVVGILLARHPRSGEMADRLLGLKDLLLVGFFLSIGLVGVPEPLAWSVAVGLLALIALRGGATLWLLTRFRLRARTSLHAALTLSTYSEFGLIVAAAALTADLIDSRWVSVLAVTVAMSFAIASLVTPRRYDLYERWAARLARLERVPIVADDAVVDLGAARQLVFGMGRVGTGAFDAMVATLASGAVGVDRSQAAVDRHRRDGRRVIRGDALDRDFWERVSFHPEIELVFAAMNNHEANLECAKRVRQFLPQVTIAAIAQHPDQIEELRRAGVDVARNLYEEAGQGLAEDAMKVVYGA